jgi:DNA-binding transcriptional MerR regulator
LQQAFTAEQTCRLTNCTPHQLRYWDRMSLVKPSIQQTGGRPGVRRLYSFRDLVALRVVHSLIVNGMSLQRVRRAWDYLRRHGDMEMHMSQMKLISEGRSLYEISAQDGLVLDALLEGQLAFFAELDQITREVTEDVTRFELDRDQFLQMLRRVEDDVSEERRASGDQ